MAARVQFPPDYQSARRNFLKAAGCTGAKVESLRNPALGAQGEALYTDVAELGSKTADHVVFACCATHGVEGFLGSAVLTGWLQSMQKKLLSGINARVVLIHAVNPYGFSWIRRVNEDNIDLNRNFTEHSRSYEKNAEYEALHGILCPPQWNQASIEVLRQSIISLQQRMGKNALEFALSKGQSTHPGGIFYTGNVAAWSNSMMRNVLQRYLGSASSSVLLDYHTGLGEFGCCSLIIEKAPADFDHRALNTDNRQAVLATGSSQSVFPELVGTLSDAVADSMPANRFLAVTVEFGTYPAQQVLETLCADNWVHQHVDDDAGLYSATKKSMKEHFCPVDPGWRAQTYATGLGVLDDILDYDRLYEKH